MVHRPADSRLLTSLLSQEKDYSKSLIGLLSTSQASLASFSAYASSSPPILANVILTVAGSLADADEALARYARAVEIWRETMKSLKGLEDDVANIIRDREILVTRLIKATKTKSSRDSVILPAQSQSQSPSHSTLSLASLSNSKLTAAQAELQACEAQLANKERELDVQRVAAVREGLSVRCRAMVECGWTWGETGKQALRALEGMGHVDHMQEAQPLNSNKPLPEPNAPSSDVSLAPSQSASQIDYNNHTNSSSSHNRLSFSLPPAHAISDTYTPMHIPHILSRRITEESLFQPPEEPPSSEDEPEPEQVQVVENVRFSEHARTPSTPSTLQNKRFSVRRGTSDSVRSEGSSRERKSSFLGNIREFFSGSRERSASASVSSTATDRVRRDHSPTKSSPLKKSSSASPLKKSGKWETRTDRNLKSQRNGNGSSDDDEVHAARPSVIPPPVTKLSKKKVSKKDTLEPNAGVTRAEEWVASSSIHEEPVAITRKPSRKKSKRKTTTSANTKFNSTSSSVDENAHLGHSRESSTVSVVSAPAALSSSPSDPPPPLPVPTSASSREAVTQQEKRASLQFHAPSSAMVLPTSSASRDAVTKRSSLPPPTRPNPSLMSIVENVSRNNLGGQKSIGGNYSVLLGQGLPSFKVEDDAGLSRRTSTGSNRPAKSPFKSALRPPSTNSSRSASPARAPAVASSPQANNSLLPPPQANVAAEPVPIPVVINGIEDDQVSIASTETGNDVFEDATDELNRPLSLVIPDNADLPLPLPPPKTDETHGAGGSDVSHSTINAEDETPKRRKSVRVSLRPTFSPTPPAIWDDERENTQSYSPWSDGANDHNNNNIHHNNDNGADAGWKTRHTTEEATERDMWEDSSEEDVEYSRARKLLNKAGKAKAK